jgi:hypothetical protein
MSAVSQTSSRGQGFCCAIALLVVVLLICGIGTIGLVSETRDLSAIYPDAAVLAEEDSAEDSESVTKGTGGKSLDNHGFASASFSVAENLSENSIPFAGQVILPLRNSGLHRAIHPTGPPAPRA